MSHYTLEDECVDYVLDEYDQCVPLHRILYQIHRAGFENVTIIAIRECLLFYRRIKRLDEPILPRPGQPAQSSPPVYLIRHKASLNNSDDASTTQDPVVAPNPAVEVPGVSWISQSQQASLFGWDAAADEFAKDAHAQGKTAPEIRELLYRNGFATTEALVVTSLTRQAVSNVPR